MRKAKDTLLSATSPRLTQRTKEVYKIKDKEVKRISRHLHHKEGKVITTSRDSAARWFQHCKKVLNQPEPNELADSDRPDNLKIRVRFPYIT